MDIHTTLEIWIMMVATKKKHFAGVFNSWETEARAKMLSMLLLHY